MTTLDTTLDELLDLHGYERTPGASDAGVTSALGFSVALTTYQEATK